MNTFIWRNSHVQSNGRHQKNRKHTDNTKCKQEQQEAQLPLREQGISSVLSSYDTLGSLALFEFRYTLRVEF